MQCLDADGNISNKQINEDLVKLNRQLDELYESQAQTKEENEQYIMKKREKARYKKRFQNVSTY